MSKKMAGWTALFLALVLLTGCGARTQSETPEETTEQAAGQDTQQIGGQDTENGESAASENDAEITMARLVEANRAAVLLDKYGSLSQTVTSEYGPQKTFWSAYTEKDLLYEQYAENPGDEAINDAAAYLSTQAGDAYYFAMDDGLLFSVCLYALPEAERDHVAPEDYEPLDPVMTQEETITAVSEEDGGAVRIDTRFASSTISYIADAETLELRSMVETGYPVVNEPDDVDDPAAGNPENADNPPVGNADDAGEPMEEETPPLMGVPVIIRTTVDPGAARPALAAEMLELLNGALSAEDTRTVAIITDPGQDEEQVYSLTVKKGVNVFPVLGETYTLCQQTEEGMIPFVSDGDMDSDRTLYAIQQDA